MDFVKYFECIFQTISYTLIYTVLLTLLYWGLIDIALLGGLIDIAPLLAFLYANYETTTCLSKYTSDIPTL